MLIASRLLKLRGSHAPIDILIRIFLPESREKDARSCRFEIDWPDGQRSVAAWGVDAVQAMLLAMQMIGAEIYTSDYHTSGKLIWRDPAQGYGFPVPPSIRDLLIGEDANL